MKLACRKCGREYELPADLTARGICQITCKACGLPVSAEAAGDRMQQAAGMDQAPRAAAPRSALPSGGAAARRAPSPVSPAGPREDEYVDLFADAAAEPAERPVPTPPPSGVRPPAFPASRPVAPEVTAAPEQPPRAPDLGSAVSEGARGSRTVLVFGGGVALLVVLVIGGLLLFRRPSAGVAAGPPAAGAGPLVISTAAPPLAAPDPEVAAAEAREEGERYARLRDSLKHEALAASVERRPAPGPAQRESAPALVGAVRPSPVAAPAQVPQVPAQRETPAPAVQAPAEPVARPAAAAAVAAVEEAPAFPTAGFEKPSQVVPGCVRSAVRLPRDLAATVSGMFTVRFAVSRNGSVGLIQVMDQVADSRISDAIASAVQSCEFRPGTDASGKPTRMWVVMPLRFVGG